MDQFDIVIIGAGAAGEAAAFKARALGASVAVVERDLVGGSCAYWACIPSKSLLHSAAVHHAGGDYPWSAASARRDYMINRALEADRPDDSGRKASLERAGATVLRGSAKLAGPGQGRGRRRARVAVAACPPGTWSWRPGPARARRASPASTPSGRGRTSRRRATRTLPASLLVLGGGPTGIELAQVFARYGVPTTIVEHNDRLNVARPSAQLRRARGGPRA